VPALQLAGYVGPDLPASACEIGTDDVLKRQLLLRELTARMVRALPTGAGGPVA
jgi:hypothetical protein